MSLQLQQYDKYPILLVQFTDAVTLSQVQAMYDACETLRRNQQHAAIWRLIDLSTANLRFNDVLDIIKAQDVGQAGSFADPNMHTVFCPPHPMARLIADLISKPQYGGREIPVFAGLGEALLYVQEQLEQGAHT